MPTSTPLDTLDDSAFLTELENFDGTLKEAVGELPRYSDRIDLLDRAFPLAGHGSPAPQPIRALGDLDAAPPHANGVRAESGHASRQTSRRYDAPALVVALVFVMGLAAGASAAALVFYDRAAQVVASWTHAHS